MFKFRSSITKLFNVQTDKRWWCLIIISHRKNMDTNLIQLIIEKKNVSLLTKLVIFYNFFWNCLGFFLIFLEQMSNETKSNNFFISIQMLHVRLSGKCFFESGFGFLVSRPFRTKFSISPRWFVHTTPWFRLVHAILELFRRCCWFNSISHTLNIQKQP